MASSPYASSLGRFKALQPTLLPKEMYGPLLQARDLSDVLKILEPTLYGPELAKAGATTRGAAVFETAVNWVLVHRLRIVQESAPFAGRSLVRAYLKRWDIENISLILSSKAENRPIAEVENQLVSSREMPAGLAAGPLTLDDLRQLLAQPTLDAVVQQLVKFGYGGPLLPLLEEYERSHNIFPLLAALWRQYYHEIVENARFFQGDEWVIRDFLKNEIDERNLLLLLKGKNADLPLETVMDRFLDGGKLGREKVPDLYNVRSVPELVTQFEPLYPTLSEGLTDFTENRSLVGFENAVVCERVVRELKRFRTFPLSISILFGFLMLSELERADLRRIIYGKLYGVSNEEISKALIVPRL